jgi:hypothetical protein
MIINGRTLRNPDWGDSVTITQNKVDLYYSRSNVMRTYIHRPSPAIVPKQRVRFSIGYNNYADIFTLFDTIKASMHQSITITDWEGNTWTQCTILTNPIEIVNMARDEGYEITLEIEGRLI